MRTAPAAAATSSRPQPSRTGNWRRSLAPGAYLLTGTFADAFDGDQPIEPPAQSVTITAGHSVREDVVANIP